MRAYTAVNIDRRELTYTPFRHEDDGNPAPLKVGNRNEGTLVGAIVGDIIGGIALLLTLTASLGLYARCRRQISELRVNTAAVALPLSLTVEVNPTSLSQSPPRPSGSIDPFRTAQISQDNPFPYFLPQTSSAMHPPQVLTSVTRKGISLVRLLHMAIPSIKGHIID